MSDAARIAYKEAHVAGASIEASLEVARNASTTAHAAQLEKWGGSLIDYAQAHVEFGDEYRRIFGTRTLISFTPEEKVAAENMEK